MTNCVEIPQLQNKLIPKVYNKVRNQQVTDTRKKKIGPYSFYHQDLIGSGNSGHVYRCIKNNKKQYIYAIKVVKIKELERPIYHLLKNQISILEILNHPNILKLHDVYYTENNCYIITDYCQGGNLQKYIDQIHEKPNKIEQIQFEQIINQLIQGCKYISSKLIIHRDIKPANVFLKQGRWKIGDFGFARTITSKQSVVYEKYSIGSPLYMPYETLKKNIYSLKTDSFALGIMLILLLNNKYPWGGKNKKQLIINYQQKQFPSYLLSELKINQNIKGFIKGLLQLDINQRYYIQQYEQVTNAQLSKSQNTLASNNEDDFGINDFMLKAKVNLQQQLKICLFVHYIIKNIQHFKQMKTLSQNLKRHLKYMVDIFQWHKIPNLSKYTNQFECLEYKDIFSTQQHKFLYAITQKHIDDLKDTVIKKCKVLRQKLIQLNTVFNCIFQKDQQEFKNSIKSLILHPQFDMVFLQGLQTLANRRISCT